MVYLQRWESCRPARPLFSCSHLVNFGTTIVWISLLYLCAYTVLSFNLDTGSTRKLNIRKFPNLFRDQNELHQMMSFSRLHLQNKNSETSDVDGTMVSDTILSNYEAVDAISEVSAPVGVSVNDRLLAELQQAAALEKSGLRNPALKENRIMKAASLFKSSKTDAERRAAIAEAQNLNGVNPVTTFFGSVFALLCAAGLWFATQALAEYFALHPSDPTDAYFVVRVTAVSRNVIMGISALASGFFGVTGFGILLLALRVGWGVVTGELDPSPPSPPTSKSTTSADNFEMDNVWDLMLNKKPKRGSR
jgi:Protein of unknown function (DUF3082)